MVKKKKSEYSFNQKKHNSNKKMKKKCYLCTLYEIHLHITSFFPFLHEDFGGRKSVFANGKQTLFRLL
jgi:hypothetical protein